MRSWLAEHRYVVAYVLVLSLLRGVVLPDFRYGEISVVGIQLLYPIMLLLPLLLHRGLISRYVPYATLGVAGIALSSVLGLASYIHWAGIKSFDIVSRAIFGQSLIAMLALFLVLYSLFWLVVSRDRQ